MKGIYLITNEINGKKYVGMSNKIDRRFMEHKTPKNINNKTTVLCKAFRKYKIENFRFEILEIVDSIDLLDEREVFWIKELKPEYNMNEGGNGNSGHQVSEETKQILRVAGKLQWASKTDAEKQKIIKNLSGPRFGRKVKDETKLKLRLANLGKKQSAETILKRSIKLKGLAAGNEYGNKAVMSYKDGVFYKEYASAKKAADEIGIHPSNITKCIKLTQKSAGGFTWKFSNNK
jgi:group I intron endonuclease